MAIQGVAVLEAFDAATHCNTLQHTATHYNTDYLTSDAIQGVAASAAFDAAARSRLIVCVT